MATILENAKAAQDWIAEKSAGATGEMKKYWDTVSEYAGQVYDQGGKFVVGDDGKLDMSDVKRVGGKISSEAKEALDFAGRKLSETGHAVYEVAAPLMEKASEFIQDNKVGLGAGVLALIGILSMGLLGEGLMGIIGALLLAAVVAGIAGFFGDGKEGFGHGIAKFLGLEKDGPAASPTLQPYQQLDRVKTTSATGEPLSEQTFNLTADGKIPLTGDPAKDQAAAAFAVQGNYMGEGENRKFHVTGIALKGADGTFRTDPDTGKPVFEDISSANIKLAVKGNFIELTDPANKELLTEAAVSEGRAKEEGRKMGQGAVNPFVEVYNRGNGRVDIAHYGKDESGNPSRTILSGTVKDGNLTITEALLGDKKATINGPVIKAVVGTDGKIDTDIVAKDANFMSAVKVIQQQNAQLNASLGAEPTLSAPAMTPAQAPTLNQPGVGAP